LIADRVHSRTVYVTGTGPEASAGVVKVSRMSALIAGYAGLSICPTSYLVTTGTTPSRLFVVLRTCQVTPITRWVKDTRPGATLGQRGYWPKQGQFDPETLYDPATQALDSKSGQIVSTAYDQILAALRR